MTPRVNTNKHTDARNTNLYERIQACLNTWVTCSNTGRTTWYYMTLILLRDIRGDHIYWEYWSASLLTQRSQLVGKPSSTGPHSTAHFLQITDEELAVQKDTHSYTVHTPLLHCWASPRALCQPSSFFYTNLCSVQNIQQVCELMPGISALFKAIYLGETSALNPLTV